MSLEIEELKCQRTHPVKNNLILQMIFGFCDVPSLKNCRLVSTKWKELSLKAWRDKAMIQVGPNQLLNFDEFLELANSEETNDSLLLRKYPWKCYSVEFSDFYSSESDDEYHEQKRFATAISNNARHVKIAYDFSHEHVDKFFEFLSILNTDSLKTLEVAWNTLFDDIPESVQPFKSSNLQRLKLFTNMFGDPHRPERTLWPILLKSFPNLEALSIGYGKMSANYGEDTDYRLCLKDRVAISKLLKDIRATGGETVFPLKEFEMIDVYTNQEENGHEPDESAIIKTLAECNFPLERLTIHVGLDGRSEIPILPLLNSCKDTLQFLRTSINFSGNYFFSNKYETDKETGRVKSILKPPKSGNICMGTLKEVILLDGLEWAMFLLAHMKTPQLEKLEVKYEKNRNPFHKCNKGLISVSLPQGKVYERLEKFELHDNLNIPSSRTIRKFAKMMPNLCHLTIPLDKSSFPLICQHFGGLRTLNVISAKRDYEEIDDECLTGVSKAQLVEGGIPLARRPNLTDLKCLTDLTICCQRQLQRNDVKFTDHCVIYGFLQIPRLFYLSMAFKELSEDTKEKLLSHVKGEVCFQKKREADVNSYAVEIISEDETL